MRESCTYGSERGALRKERPYRDRPEALVALAASLIPRVTQQRSSHTTKLMLGYARIVRHGKARAAAVGAALILLSQKAAG